MTRGIVLVSVGEKGYAYMAYNLAYSIKHFNKDVKIQLIVDGSIEYLPPVKRNVFDVITSPKVEDYTSSGKLDPGKLKTHIYDYLAFDSCLYLDVDALALRDMNEVLKDLDQDGRFYITSEQGRGKLTDSIAYSEWTSNEVMGEVFGLSEGQELVAIQSSWAYIRKCKEAKAFFKEVSKCFDRLPLNRLRIDWGGTMPDEAIFSGVISKRDMRVDGPDNMIFFGSQSTLQTSTEIEEQFCVLSVYGTGVGRPMTPRRYWDMYDSLMFRWTREARAKGSQDEHIYKSGIIMQYKHANNNKRRG